MKRISALMFVLAMLWLASNVLANEGTAYLKPEAGQTGGCFVVSIYMDGGYKVMASCRDLPVAWSAEKNRYILWRVSGDKVVRVGEIVAGKLANNVNDKFERLLVSAEVDGYANKPSEDVVVSGALEPLVFGNNSGKSFYTPTPSSSQTTILTPTPASGNKLAGAIVGIGKVVIFGFVLLLVVVGVLGFLARKRGL